MPTKSEKKFKVGDEVILVEPTFSRNSPSRQYPAVVIRVGTKYAYVEIKDEDRQPWWVEKCGFDLVTGREAGANNYAKRITTPEILAEEERRNKVDAALHEAGLRFDWPVKRNLSTDQLEKLLAVMKEEN